MSYGTRLNFQPFLARLAQTPLAPWGDALADAVRIQLSPGAHGDLASWEDALSDLPVLPDGETVLERSCVGIHPFDSAQGEPFDSAHCAERSRSTHAERSRSKGPPLDRETEQRLRNALMRLHPWRKGPYCIQGVHIDTEWRSDWKWDRLANAIAPLNGRLVLDVGCGNGYHGWRMLGAGANLVLGIDPTLVFVAQFMAINRYLARNDLAVLPLGIEDLPGELTGFDTVFSMGVLYHRRSPMDHLGELRRLLRPGGELILETLVLEDDGERVLVPPGRYAGMRNVWFIPSIAALSIWLGRCGFAAVRVIDVSRTTGEEQRSTAWMRFQSLRDHLDPDDVNRTIEKLPAPTRAILTAQRR